MQPFLKTASKILPKLDSKAPELWAINCKRDGMKDLCKSQVTHKYPYIVLYKGGDASAKSTDHSKWPLPSVSMGQEESVR